MMMPPIVGVPALAWCSCGPSSRICWPNSRSRRNSMNLGDRKTQISSDAVPAIRTSPMPQRLARDRDVVERLLAPAGELLPLLVALAGDHHHVAGARHAHSLEDRRPAVGVVLDVGASAGSGQDLGDDR